MGDGNFDLGALGGWMGGLFGGQGNPLHSPATGNGMNIRPNMNPAQNSWNGDNFVIGKPQVNGGPGHSVPGTIPAGGGGGMNPAPSGGGAGANPFTAGMMGLNMMQQSQPDRMQVSDLQPMQRPQMAPPQMPQSTMPNAMRARMPQMQPQTQLSMVPPGQQNPFMRRMGR
jgi:hypothetical protein